MVFGETKPKALQRATVTVRSIRQAAADLAGSPFRGTRPDVLLPGLRLVTLERVISWFRIGQATPTVHILAVFFGAQDHTRRMILRLLSDEPGPG